MKEGAIATPDGAIFNPGGVLSRNVFLKKEVQAVGEGNHGDGQYLQGVGEWVEGWVGRLG